MPKTATKKKKDQGELVVRTPSEPFYKAFLVPDKNVETIVDVSGDTFSYTMEDAVLAELYRHSMEELFKISLAELFIGDEEVDIDSVSSEDYSGSIVIMAIRATYDAEFEAGKVPAEDVVETSEKPREFMFRMKALAEGYGLGIQDYRIEVLKMVKSSPEGSDFTIKECKLRIDDVQHKNAAFPDTLDIM